MGKQNEEGRRKRREALIRYISEHQPVRGKDICDTLYHGARQSFNDDRKAINRNGDIIVSTKSGYIIRPASVPSGSSAPENQDTGSSSVPVPKVTEKLDKKSIRMWQILAILSRGRGMTFNDLLKELNRCDFTCSESTLHKDLSFLIDTGLVSCKKSIPESKGNAPDRRIPRRCYDSSAVTQTTREEMEHYAGASLQNRSEYSGIESDVQEDILSQIRVLLPYTEDFDPGSGIIRIGKKARLSRAQSDAVEKLISLKYTENVLDLYYRPISGTSETEHVLFCSGLLLYSFETTRLYLLGRSDDPKQKNPTNSIIDVTTIEFAKTLAGTKQLGQKKFSSLRLEFRQIAKEMFDISLDPPMDVRILVKDKAYLTEKFRHLKEVREKAGNHPEFFFDEKTSCRVYTDRIRGMESFARYLRGLGSDVLVKSPEILAERMKGTSDRVIALYTEERS